MMISTLATPTAVVVSFFHLMDNIKSFIKNKTFTLISVIKITPRQQNKSLQNFFVIKLLLPNCSNINRDLKIMLKLDHFKQLVSSISMCNCFRWNWRSRYVLCVNMCFIIYSSSVTFFNHSLSN